MGRYKIDLKERMNNTIFEDPYYTIFEVADLLKCDHKTIRRAIQRGEIKAQKIGKLWRIKKEDLLKGE